MADLFLKTVNMSISAGWIVVAIVLFRLLLKKAPKWITVALWGIVAIRLLCPFSIESVLSMIPSAETVSPSIMTDEVPAIHSGISAINSAINPIIEKNFSPAPGASANPLQVWIPILAAAWIAGILILLGYICISYLRLQKKIGTAVLLRGNIYQSENVVSPFVLGVVKPKIYLPFSISAEDLSHVVAHEEAHISRKDHLWKPLGFLLLTLHWFNPLMWLGYILLCRDIELACDEKVIKQLDTEGKADYSQALLTCSANRRSIAACPLAFGEVGVKERVKTVLKYKKPALWVTVAAVALCVFFAACSLTDPKTEVYGENDPTKLADAQIRMMEKYPQFFGLDATNGLDVYVSQFAPGNYSFLVTPHTEEPLDSLELLKRGGCYGYEMRTVLSTYDIGEEDVYIIPWQPMHSSYIPTYFWELNGQDNERHRQEYIENVRRMLFDGYEVVYHTALFDIDGDGTEESCTLRMGPAADVFTIDFVVTEQGKTTVKYQTLFYSQLYDPRFQTDDDGITRVEGTTRQGVTHLLNISVIDEKIYLTENGVSIEDIR
ncbi:MAG: hypothetical protein E7461_00845 [Ruminococcaceae bacterium]|nr:hypothetical protein [Oscillospiraceae bacterium]